MSTFLRTSAASQIALLATIGILGFATASAATAAEPIKSASIDKITSQFDTKAVIRMRDSGNGYVFDKAETALIKMRIKAEVRATSWIQVANVALHNRPLYSLPLEYKPKALDEIVQTTVTAADLEAFHANAAAKCNLGGEPGKTVTLPFLIGVGLEVVAPLGITSQTVNKSETFEAFVVCGPRKAPKGPGGLVSKEPDFSVEGVHVRFATTAGYPSKPDPATQCQLTEARARIETSKAGPVKFKLWTKVGGEPARSQLVEAMSSHVGPGKYEANYKKTIAVTKTTSVQAMVEDLTNPIGQSTGWKAVTVHCTGAGGGGFAGTPGTSNPDGLPMPAKPVRPAVDSGKVDLTGGKRPAHGTTGAPVKATIEKLPLPRPDATPGAKPGVKPHVKTAPAGRDAGLPERAIVKRGEAGRG